MIQSTVFFIFSIYVDEGGVHLCENERLLESISQASCVVLMIEIDSRLIARFMLRSPKLAFGCVGSL